MLRAAIQRPIAVAMLFLALVLLGLISYQRLPVDLLPAITYPRLTVITTYEDIPAEDLERLVTQPLEEVITALTGVRGVTSRTREGISAVTVEYEWGTQMDFANLHLREAVDRVAFRDDFPAAAERPTILRWDPTSRPISIMVLDGEGRRLEDLTEFAEEVVKPALEQVDGISQAEVVGGAEREILVMPDPQKLAIYSIEVEDIRQALMRSNVSFPGGRIRQGPLHLSLRIAGEFETLEQIEATDIVSPGRSAIRVGDVARVIDTVKEPEGATLLGDKQVVSLLLYKEPDANTIQVSDEVDRSLVSLAEDSGDFAYEFVYRDAEYVKASFEGLRQSLIVGAVLAFGVLFFFLGNVRSPLIVGISIPVSIFITFGLLYFGKVNLNLMSLGGLSLAAGMLVDNAIVVLENINRHYKNRREAASLAQDSIEPGVPAVSELGAAPVADAAVERSEQLEDLLAGETPVELAEDIVAVTVDEVDPHDRFVTEDQRIMAECSEQGAREMARPVLAATLTTIAVFFPVVYVPGIAGAFFRDQALTVTFSLMVSIAAALLLQPVIAARAPRWFLVGLGAFALFMLFLPHLWTGVVMRIVGEDHEIGVVRIVDGLVEQVPMLPLGVVIALPIIFAIILPLLPRFERGFEHFHELYHAALDKALGHRRIMLVALVVGLVAVGFYGQTLRRSFMPERSSGDMRLDVELPAGTPLEETSAIIADLGGWIEADPAVKAVFIQVGRTERTLAALNEYTAPNTARVRIILHPSRGAHREGQRIEGEIVERLERLPGLQYAFREEGIGLGEILSSGGAAFSMGIVAEEAQTAVAVADDVARALGEVDGLVDIKVDRVLGNPNVVVRLDREEILRSGLDPERMAVELRNRIAGVEATTFNEVEKRIDISVRFERPTRLDFSRALSSPVRVGEGRTVPLSSFLIITEERPVRELIRHNQRRMVTVSADVRNRSLDEVWAEAVVAANSVVGQESVSFVQGGEREDRNSSFRDLGWAMMLAIVLVYMILAAQFESFMDPLLIAAVLPIGVAGSLLAIGITGNTINILSMIGAVALLGIAVNDAIVKVDTIRRLRADGLPGRQAVLEASRLRLRPILMTSITTVLAMVPMAVGLGSGEQLQRPLAITIIGGLMLTTALTLFYTPILYEWAHGITRGGEGGDHPPHEGTD